MQNAPLQGEHSAFLLTSIKLPFVIKIFVLSVFEWPFYSGFTVDYHILHVACSQFSYMYYTFQKANNKCAD